MPKGQTPKHVLTSDINKLSRLYSVQEHTHVHTYTIKERKRKGGLEFERGKGSQYMELLGGKKGKGEIM